MAETIKTSSVKIDCCTYNLFPQTASASKELHKRQLFTIETDDKITFKKRELSTSYGNVHGTLDVISCGTNFEILNSSTLIYRLCRQADDIFASTVLFARLGEIASVRHTIAEQPQKDANDALQLVSTGRHVVVLCSGDALYHGMGGIIAKELQHQPLPDCNIRFHPGITAFQVLCHKIRLPWSMAQLFSAHFRIPPLRHYLESPLAIIYAGSRYTASGLARALINLHPASAKRSCILAEYLDSPQEHLCQTTLGDAAHMLTGPTSILVLLPEGATSPILSLGLNNDYYKFEKHIITSPEVRAVILAKLVLPAWGVLWDLGAGSGSVGLEACGLRTGLNVWAVENKKERCRNIELNRKRLGVANYHLLHGDILSLLDTMPKPDRVFVGGGGSSIKNIVQKSLAKLRPGGILAAVAVTLETVARLEATAKELRMSVTSIDISTDMNIGKGESHILSPNNRIHIFTFRAAGDYPLSAQDHGAQLYEQKSNGQEK